MENATKYETTWIKKDKNKPPIFIVGMCPGRQRLKQQTKKVFEGNQTGDLIQKIVKNAENVYLTNVLNYYVKGKITSEHVKLGKIDLLNDLKFYLPKKIVCLGEFAHNHVQECYKNVLAIDKPQILQYKHPSWVIRFKKHDKAYYDDYARMLKQVLEVKKCQENKEK